MSQIPRISPSVDWGIGDTAERNEKSISIFNCSSDKLMLIYANSFFTYIITHKTANCKWSGTNDRKKLKIFRAIFFTIMW